MHNNRLNRRLFPVNNAQGQGALGASAIEYINNIKSSSSDLSNALRDLSGSAFSQRTMVSSNSDVMTVNFSGGNLSNVNDLSVQIDQIAMGQLNEGSRVSSSAQYSGDRGINRFEIETGGRTTQLSINITASDSNRDVQQKMATAINNAGLGLRATVEVDSQTNMSMLRVESTNVGTSERNAFTITDITGNAAEQLGANDVSRERQDAIFRVNGGEAQVSQSNIINLGNGISATLLAESEEEVRVTRGTDMGRAISAVEAMVRSYNNLFTASAGNISDPKAQGLASRMINVSGAYSRALSDIGISFDGSGRMTVNSQKLSQAAENGRLEQFFTENRGKNFGFTAMLGRLADNVSTNTTQFVSSSVFDNRLSGDFGYSGGGNPVSINSMRTGSMFDFTF
jgi:flagellar capping protein FliD